MNSVQVSGCAAVVLGLALVSTPMAATAKTITVSPGQSIQAAVNTAAPGDTVMVKHGTYIETASPYSDEQQPKGGAAVLIAKPLTLTAYGDGPVYILPIEDYQECKDNQATNPHLCQTDGIVAEGTAKKDINGLVIKGFTVDGFHNNGIKLAHVKNFSIENNASINNEENGIWPTLSANGEVKRNIAYGAKDSALWVEASQNIRVIDNDLSTSPTGLEVTISQNVTMENNNIHDNTVGIGLYHPAAAGLPQANWPQGPYGHWQVVNNYVHDNNAANTAEPGSEVYLLPPGLGMLLLGVDRVDVEENRIEKNNFVGIGMIDWCVALGDPGCLNTKLPAGFEDTAVDYDEIEGNRFAGNHTGPPLVLPFGELPASDILYLGADSFGPLPPGTHNCQSDNTAPNNAPAFIIALPETGLPMCDDDEQGHDDHDQGHDDHGHGDHGHDDHGHGDQGHGDQGHDDHHPH